MKTSCQIHSSASAAEHRGVSACGRSGVSMQFVTVISCEVAGFGTVDVIVKSNDPTGSIGAELVRDTAMRLGQALQECADDMPREAVRGFRLLRDLAANESGGWDPEC